MSAGSNKFAQFRSGNPYGAYHFTKTMSAIVLQRKEWQTSYLDWPTCYSSQSSFVEVYQYDPLRSSLWSALNALAQQYKANEFTNIRRDYRIVLMSKSRHQTSQSHQQCASTLVDVLPAFSVSSSSSDLASLLPQLSGLFYDLFMLLKLTRRSMSGLGIRIHTPSSTYRHRGS